MLKEKKRSQVETPSNPQSNLNTEEATRDFENLVRKFSAYIQEDELKNEDWDSDDDDWSCTDIDGSDGDHAVQRRSRFPSYNPKDKNVSFSLGMTFRGPSEFKDVITRY